MKPLKKHLRPVVKGIMIGVVLMIAFLSMPLMWGIYVTFIFPMGRLAGSIDGGESLATVQVRIDDYCAKYSDRSSLDCDSGSVSDLPGWQHVCDWSAARFIHLMDYQILDDIQLYVFFDESGRVCDKIYWGD